jgi:tetratricopeptide (TPR) repeat protein
MKLTQKIMLFKISIVIFILIAISPGAGTAQEVDWLPLSFLGLGDVHHPVSTKSADAQKFFDQGLALVYAFNHDEAVRSFKNAAVLDPEFAMAYWGIALALGPNINLPVDAEHEKAAYEAVQKAQALSVNTPEQERAYIKALSKRYSSDPKADLRKLDVDYKNAMQELMRQYQDDPDAATLYAESAMDLRPWMLWKPDGRPAEGTQEIMDVLESVLRRNPNHLGANHYYIHTVEASPHPEWALPSADRLKALAPYTGHLVHMPAHIYSRTGFYEEAAVVNEVAVAADRAYIQLRGDQGFYSLGYYSHNLHFLAVMRAFQGRFFDAMKAADELAAHVGPQVKEIPLLEGFMPHSLLIMVRFEKWDDILTYAPPNEAMVMTRCFWHFARAVAYASTGKPDLADGERRAFLEKRKHLAADAMYSPLNRAESILSIAGMMLDARIAEKAGDHKLGVEFLKKAMAAEDALNYNEPPEWYISSSEALGGLLLRTRNYAEAEKVFRAELVRHPRSGRALFGLYESLKGLGKDYVSEVVHEEFKKAWQYADTKLGVEDL